MTDFTLTAAEATRAGSPVTFLDAKIGGQNLQLGTILPKGHWEHPEDTGYRIVLNGDVATDLGYDESQRFETAEACVESVRQRIAAVLAD